MACTLDTSSAMAHSPGMGPKVATEVHVQSGYDDTYTVVGKLVAYIDQTLVKELRFINATTSISDVNNRILADESIGVEDMVWLSCDTTSASE